MLATSSTPYCRSTPMCASPDSIVADGDFGRLDSCIAFVMRSIWSRRQRLIIEMFRSGSMLSV